MSNIERAGGANKQEPTTPEYNNSNSPLASAAKKINSTAERIIDRSYGSEEKNKWTFSVIQNVDPNVAKIAKQTFSQ